MTKNERKSVSAKGNPVSEGALLILEEFLPYRLVALAETVSQSLSHIYASRYGISIAEWRVIATLGQFEKVTAKNIGLHSNMHKTKVSRATAELESRGLIKRQENEADKREALIFLTEAGLAMYAGIVPFAIEFENELKKGLADQDQRALSAAISHLRARALQLAPVEREE